MNHRTLGGLRTREDALQASLEEIRRGTEKARELRSEERRLEGSRDAHRGTVAPYRAPDSLERDIAQARRAREAVEPPRGREDAVMREIESVRRQIESLGVRRQLPHLATLHVAAPCPALWSEMSGTDSTRFCAMCKKNVHDLTAMTAEQAEALLESKARGDVCVRFYRRTDGTVLTDDCPWGTRRRHRIRRLSIGIAAVGMLAAAGAAVQASAAEHARPAAITQGFE